MQLAILFDGYMDSHWQKNRTSFCFLVFSLKTHFPLWPGDTCLIKLFFLQQLHFIRRIRVGSRLSPFLLWTHSACLQAMTSCQGIVCKHAFPLYVLVVLRTHIIRYNTPSPPPPRSHSVTQISRTRDYYCYYFLFLLLHPNNPSFFFVTFSLLLSAVLFSLFCMYRVTGNECDF